MFKYHSFVEIPYGAHTQVVNAVGNDKRVLDVGCATGYIAKKLKEQGCEVTGLDISPEAIKEARQVCDQAFVADVQVGLPNEIKKSSFDYIVLADVLEHLTEPQNALQNLSPYLKPTGQVLISTPNIANYAVRLRLLAGRFDYTESGIMDRTHLHFFTHRSLIEMLDRAGYQIVRFDYTPGLDQTELYGRTFGRILRRFSFGRRIEHLATRCFPTLLALQFFVLAKKKQ